MKRVGMAPAEDQYSDLVGEELFRLAERAWEEGGRRIGRHLDPRFVVAVLMYAFRKAEVTCGTLGPSPTT